MEKRDITGGLTPTAEPIECVPRSAAETSRPEQLARLIFLSYRFSQGGIGTQNRILLHIEEKDHPDLFSPELLPEVEARTADMVSAFFLNEKTHPATAIPWEDPSPDTFVKTPLLVTNELAGLFERFTYRQPLRGFDHDPASIAMSVVAMDIDYLRRSGGRAGDSTELKVRVGPYARDPFDSMFIKYGLLGTPTHTPEYDNMFKCISSDESISKLDQLALSQLLEVIEIYISNHPNSNIEDRLDATRILIKELIHG